MAAEAALHPKATRKVRWAWYLYDFGNSAYAAVVLLAIFSQYYKEGVVDPVLGIGEGSRLWGLAVGIAMLTVAITAPILGSIADYSAFKKRFLFWYTALACVFTSLLFFVGRGDWLLGMILFIFAEIGYRSAQVFYNALLPEIAAPEEMAEVSGNGWAVGSAGGIICLGIVLALILTDKSGNGLAVRLAFPITGIFWALSSYPAFAWITEQAEAQPLPAGMTYFSLARQRTGEMFRKVRNYREYLKFIAAFLIYNDGIIMALEFAAIIGAVLYGMPTEALIVFMLMVQGASVIGAYFFGWLAKRITSKQSLLISLVMMTAVVIWMFFNQTLTGFYIIGGIAGFALTGVQSVSRTMAGLFAPPGQSGEFYGVFAIAGRGSSFIGPTVYGFLATGVARRLIASGTNPDLADQMGQKSGILAIAVFLVIGLIVLLAVNEKKGREQALSGGAVVAAAAD